MKTKIDIEKDSDDPLLRYQNLFHTLPLNKQL